MRVTFVCNYCRRPEERNIDGMLKEIESNTSEGK